MTRALGIDYGDKRTGIAIGETESRVASPWTMFENLSDANLVTAIARLVSTEEIAIIVCGIPLNMDGRTGPQAQKVEKFIALLEAATGFQIVRVDERLTSHEAESRIAGHYTRKQKRRRIDAIAAAGILQEFLNHFLSDAS